MAEEKAKRLTLQYLVQGCLPSQTGFKVMQERVTRTERRERTLQGLESGKGWQKTEVLYVSRLRAEKREDFSVALHWHSDGTLCQWSLT